MCLAAGSTANQGKGRRVPCVQQWGDLPGPERVLGLRTTWPATGSATHERGRRPRCKVDVERDCWVCAVPGAFRGRSRLVFVPSLSSRIPEASGRVVVGRTASTGRPSGRVVNSNAERGWPRWCRCVAVSSAMVAAMVDGHPHGRRGRAGAVVVRRLMAGGQAHDMTSPHRCRYAQRPPGVVRRGGVPRLPSRGRAKRR